MTSQAVKIISKMALIPNQGSLHVQNRINHSSLYMVIPINIIIILRSKAWNFMGPMDFQKI
jgi:hypothetical protein